VGLSIIHVSSPSGLLREGRVRNNIKTIVVAIS
jgi:hypothetical protein